MIRDTLGDLMIRIAVLEAENAQLRAQLAEKNGVAQQAEQRG